MGGHSPDGRAVCALHLQTPQTGPDPASERRSWGLIVAQGPAPCPPAPPPPPCVGWSMFWSKGRGGGGGHQRVPLPQSHPLALAAVPLFSLRGLWRPPPNAPLSTDPPPVLPPPPPQTDMAVVQPRIREANGPIHLPLVTKSNPKAARPHKAKAHNTTPGPKGRALTYMLASQDCLPLSPDQALPDTSLRFPGPQSRSMSPLMSLSQPLNGDVHFPWMEQQVPNAVALRCNPPPPPMSGWASAGARGRGRGVE